MQCVWPCVVHSSVSTMSAPHRSCPPPSPYVHSFIPSPSSSCLCPCTVTLSTRASLPMPASSTWAGLTLCVPTYLEVSGSVHLSAHGGTKGCGVSSGTPSPRTAPKAMDPSTLPPPQSVPEKQKPARDDGGGGRVPRHSSTSEVRSMPRQVPPTSNTPTPSQQPSHRTASVCTHRKQCLAEALQPPILIPSPQP